MLAHENTLFLSATGSGKSLTYLVPTLLWKQARRQAPAGGVAGGACGLTLVVSPLLALIRDQLQNLPRGLEGAGLSSDMTSGEQAHVMQRLLAGAVDVLYIAPERIMSPLFIQHMANLTRGGARPVQLVVIDEAHCTSSWAANFRPALLRLERFFRETLPVCSLPCRLPSPPDTRYCRPGLHSCLCCRTIVSSCLPPASCFPPPASRFPPPASCLPLPASRFLPPTSCLPLPARQSPLALPCSRLLSCDAKSAWRRERTGGKASRWQALTRRVWACVPVLALGGAAHVSTMLKGVHRAGVDHAGPHGHSHSPHRRPHPPPPPSSIPWPAVGRGWWGAA